MQKRAVQLAAKEAAAEAHCQARRTFEMLTACAEQIQLKPVPAAHPPTTPKLILDAVCLLTKPQVPVLRQQLGRLGDELGDKGMSFQLIGPWPPYHFSAQAQNHVGLP